MKVCTFLQWIILRNQPHIIFTVLWKVYQAEMCLQCSSEHSIGCYQVKEILLEFSDWLIDWPTI